MVKYIAFFLILMLAFNAASSQDKAFSNFKIASYIGGRDFKIDSFPNNESLDFVNYIYAEDDYLDYIYWGFSVQFDLYEKWKADIKLVLSDNLVPNNHNITVQYMFNDFVGINMGYIGFNQFINDHISYQRLTNPEYLDYGQEFEQIRIYDYGFMGGPILNYTLNRLAVELKANVGFSNTIPFSTMVVQKQVDGNKRRTIHYSVENNFSFFVQQELKLSFDCFINQNSTIGLQIQSNWYYTQKSLNYNRTSKEWIDQHTMRNYIIGPKHYYSKFELDLGVYVKF